ncbi:hypothetical protein [uncultured Dysosmobacter sp.]|nr:hypothetical protein [uncultured Dysosmobacter sp.]
MEEKEKIVNKETTGTKSLMIETGKRKKKVDHRPRQRRSCV